MAKEIFGVDVGVERLQNRGWIGDRRKVRFQQIGPEVVEFEEDGRKFGEGFARVAVVRQMALAL